MTKIRLKVDINVDSKLTLRAGDEFEVDCSGTSNFGAHYWFILPDKRRMFVNMWEAIVVDDGGLDAIIND